ncbi:MAG: inositol monophosphatase family protein [Hyphomicrobiaceae bacterium]
MTMIDMSAVADVLRDVAATEILPRWRNLAAHEVTRKTGENAGLVTVADQAAEAALSERLRALLAGSTVVGEEAVAADRRILDRFTQSAPVWVIDPIDGTRRFAEGARTFDVMVGLVVEGRPVAGWIFSPVEDVFYMGHQGCGSRMIRGGKSSAITSDHGRALEAMEGIVGTGAFVQRGYRDPKAALARFAGYGKRQCAGHNYGRLFQGTSHFLVNFSTHPWDHLPGIAIATAAGFTAARHDGRPFDPLDRHGGILVAPSQQSWDEIHGALFVKP